MELLFLALLIVLMAAALGAGFPVAFALPGAAILSVAVAAGAGALFADNPDAYFAQGGPVQWLSAGVTNFRGIYWEAERDTLIAIPLFIFMGIMLQRSRIAEDLLITMAQMFGRIPGGLGISVVFVGALLAATTGIVGATVVAMGLISLPAMLQNNYSRPLATGTVAASGTLGQIIPPSIVLIILADQLASATDQASTTRKALYKHATGEPTMPSAFDISSTSAGEMFLGAFIPGLVLVGLYMAFILGIALLRPGVAPAVPRSAVGDRGFVVRVLVILVPPLTLIFLVLGSILSGVATVNQAGAIGAVGALIMAGYRLTAGTPGAYRPAALAIAAVVVLGAALSIHEINVKRIDTGRDVAALVVAAIAVAALLVSIVWSAWRALRIEDTLRGVMIETAKTTSLVFIILLGAAMLTAAFRAFGGEELVRDFLQGLPGGFWSQFVIVMLVIFVLGFFLDFIEIAVVVVPIVAPILLADPSANVTAVWLGVMIGLNIQTSFLTPPFGFALFYLRGVASATVRTIEMYKGVVPFICLQLFALAIVGVTPALVNYLPNRISLLSETAPPPINPRLQACVEEHVFARYESGQGELDRALSDVGALDLSDLPSKPRRALESSFETVAGVPELVAAVRTAEQAREAAETGYIPVLREVRAIERVVRRLDTESARLKRDANRVGRTGKEEAAIAELDREREGLLAQIPAHWDSEREGFAQLLAAEARARTTYRRTVDTAYGALRETIGILRGADGLAELAPRIGELDVVIATTEPKQASQAIRQAERELRAVPGSRSLVSALSKVRKTLRKRRPDIEKVRGQLAKVLETMEAEVAWRRAAAVSILPGLERFELEIRETVGLRQQPRLPPDAALDVAACNSDHRTLEAHF